MMGEHSPTPWHVDDEIPPNGFDVFMRVGRVPISSSCVGPDDSSNDRENARHIVHCVNLFPELVAALQDLLQQITDTPDEWLTDECEGWSCSQAGAVLAKAKGGAPSTPTK